MISLRASTELFILRCNAGVRLGRPENFVKPALRLPLTGPAEPHRGKSLRLATRCQAGGGDVLGDYEVLKSDVSFKTN
jgi:hypothetical protein